MAAHSTRQAKHKKPRKDFPLFPHARGYWAKKILGRTHYFGKIESDPKGVAARNQWLDQRDDLLAGRVPRVKGDSLTVATLCNHFLTAKEQSRDAGEIKRRTFEDLFRTCKYLCSAFGKGRLVDDLAAADFQSLRGRLAKINGPERLAVEVQRIRSIFKYGHDNDLLDKPVRFGSTFVKPSAKVLREHKQAKGERMFEPSELRAIIDKADQPLKAMILLAANCGFGNSDCGTLPKRALDLDGAMVKFPRPKTSVERSCPLWPETIAALREAMEQSPKAKQKQHDALMFLTKYGQPWSKETADNPVSRAFRLLLDNLKLYRPGLSFYALRHMFETIAGDSRDQVAVNHIMGHSDNHMSERYRERIEVARLKAVTDHVHRWLFDQTGDQQ